MFDPMTEEMQTAIIRLQGLPLSDQNRLAPRINDYLNKLEALRNTMQSSYQSGPAREFDAEDLKRRGRERLKAQQHNGSH